MLQSLSLLALLSASCAIWLDLYEHDNTNGNKVRLTEPVDWLGNVHFNDAASSARADGNWELYSNWNFEGLRMVVEGGRHYNNLGGTFNDAVSSARPTCIYTGDANDALLEVWEDGDHRGNKKSYTKDESYLNDWNDKISSACAVKGDWELYEHYLFTGVRWVIKENECHNIVAHNDYYTSLRPLCASYHPKCTVQKVRVGSQGLLTPRYESTEGYRR
ncbi:epidermal differentiation-specific protein-like [Bolinopsis microptera]|uniref:epidermal differentiation-specific protein-like n=1 Tax=Bolinopsis microptera TaxID=2820187 RepID=UPI003079E9AD